MPLEPFDMVCHDVALAEMRVVQVPGPSALGPGGKYFLREFYCTEQGCDCRRVLVQFIEEARPSRVAASINYGWETIRFYKKWSRGPGPWREMAGATLEPFAEQGPHAAEFLKVFDHIIKVNDAELVAAFRRHYALVKKTLPKP
jgi:hypothetical protein